ncbi:unnamed protein product, partial [Phaeothamnion confervicola]
PDQQWVQCDRPKCKKWRKLAPGRDPDDLPEKWYCAMNDWEPRLARCEAPEEAGDYAD